MRKGFHQLLTHTAAAVAGLTLCVFFFREHEWMCGPLRSDLAPLWAAAAAGFAAAAATFVAVLVAVNGGKRAIEAERALRNEENNRAVDERKRQARSIAAAFIRSVRDVALSAECWRRLVDNERVPMKNILEKIANFPMHYLNALVLRVELFDEEDAQKIGKIYGHISDLVEQSKDNMAKAGSLGADLASVQRSDFGKNIVAMIGPSLDAYKSLENLSGDINMYDPTSAGADYYDGTIDEMIEWGIIPNETTDDPDCNETESADECVPTIVSN